MVENFEVHIRAPSITPPTGRAKASAFSVMTSPHGWVIQKMTLEPTVRRMETASDMHLLAAEICDSIESHAADGRIAWNSDRTEVRVLLDLALAERFPVTDGSRQRLTEALQSEAAERGWSELHETTTFKVT